MSSTITPEQTPDAAYHAEEPPTANHGTPSRARRAVVVGLAAAAVAGLGIGGWQLHGTTQELNEMRADASAREHAEQVALDYATAAAQMNFQDLAAWKERLTAGTTPELRGRLTQAAASMEQIIVPLQWSSTAQPITAKATQVENGVYTVDSFVSVFTSNAQAPEGIQSTATYTLTIDGNNGWTITEISGIGPAGADADLPPR